ncbi:MAG TPA: cupredoxin domain-containing protein [Solirubrobacterales bacterium]|nr:cupredoxin domain-containing protein [Solirubrobacterales bacterium]
MTTSLQRHGRGALALVIGLALLATLAVLQGEASGRATMATASGAKNVSIVNFAFKPGTVKVKRGGRVTFTNTANTAHTATHAGVFDTKRIQPGESETVKLERRGTFAYHCKIHPFMKGKIVVE